MNPSTAVARRLVNALVEAGVEHVVYCPGSRDAPIGYALADAETAGWLRVYVRLDERSAGFVALGLGRAGCPAALVTTSGTAVANIHPAVLEADAAGVPLIVLSADRPAEMWHTGANQTTVQTGIFGSAPRLSTDVPAGFPADERLDALVLRAVTAATGALSADPGPVHLNVSFRDSLVPDGPWRPQALVPRRVSPFPTAPTPLVMPARTVVVAGDGAGSLARELAQQGGWPLLAEPTSGSRVGDNALTDYQTVLGSELVDDVEAVLVLGHPTLSRPVSRLLARPDVTVVTDRSRWTDVAGVARVVTGPVELAEIDTDPAWLGRWKDADRPVVPTAKQRLCRDIWWACTTPNAPVLVIGASEVIRCFDLLCPATSLQRRWPTGGWQASTAPSLRRSVWGWAPVGRCVLSSAISPSPTTPCPCCWERPNLNLTCRLSSWTTVVGRFLAALSTPLPPRLCCDGCF